MSYQQPNQYNASNQGQATPGVRLRTDFSLGKFILLSFITFGIYGIIVMSRVVDNVNTIASPYDGKKTMNYFGAMLLGIVTFGIYPLVWFHQFSDRVGNELNRRNITSDFSSTTFWLWFVLGAIIIVGPFIYYDRLFKSVIAMTESYNTYGY